MEEGLSLYSRNQRMGFLHPERISQGIQDPEFILYLKSQTCLQIIFKRKGENQMKHSILLVITSLLSILFMTFHLTDDIIFGMEKGGPSNLIAVPILVAWLYGTLVLAERRSGYVTILVGSLLGLLVPVLHMTGAGVGGEFA
jgi:hypothetical protein